MDLTSFDDCPYIKAKDRLNFLSFFIVKSVTDAVKSVKEWKGCESISNILEKNLLVFEERIQDLFRNQSKQPYQILVHGDFSFKNMMFRNEGRKSEDFLLVSSEFFVILL